MNPGIVPTDYYAHEAGLSLEDLRVACEVIAQGEVIGIEIAEFQISWSSGMPVSPAPFDLQLNLNFPMLSQGFVRRLFQLLVGAALVASFLFPLIEYFDRWDSTATPSSDTELYVLCLIVGVAIVFALRSQLRFLPELLASDLLFLSAVRFLKPAAWMVPLTTLNSSPPVPLKI